MGPIILAMLFPFILVFFVLYANKHQKKSKEAFEKICLEQGWELQSLDKGYNLLPQNEEEWKLEVRPGSQNTSTSVTWSHTMEPNTPLVILTKMGIGIMNEIPIKGLQHTQPEVLGNLRPISAGSRVSHRYGIYGVVDSNEHPFLTQAIEDRLLSYQGGNLILVLLPNRLEIRLRDRNVFAQFPPLIQLGKDIVHLHRNSS